MEAGMRNDTTVFVGLGVHKDSIAAAYSIGVGEIQDLGNINREIGSRPTGVMHASWSKRCA